MTIHDRVLACLPTEGGRSIEEVAAELGYSPEQVRFAINRCQRKGLVRLEQKPRTGGYGGGGTRGRYVRIRQAEPLRCAVGRIASVFHLGAMA